MALIPVVESDVSIQVNGNTEGNFSQKVDSAYNIDVSTSSNYSPNPFYRTNFNGTLSPLGNNERDYILRGGESHPEFSVNGFVEVLDSEDEFQGYPVVYNGVNTNINEALGNGESISWSDSGSGSVDFYVEDPSFFDPVFDINFSMEYTGLSSSSGFNVGNTNKL